MGHEAIQKALEEIRKGRMVVLVDDEDRENEGDLVMAAEKVTPDAINFMAKYGRGLICLTLTEEKVHQLGLQMMTADNRSPFSTAFTVSIEAREGVTTGISAADRSVTIQCAMQDNCKPEDLVTPGHVFPLQARNGGVLRRTGQTEGSVDLARMAGLKPAGVICEILNDDGTMARRDDLKKYIAQHDLVMISVAEMVEYRLQSESLVEKVATTHLPLTPNTEWEVSVFRNQLNNNEHLAFVLGDLNPENAPLVRVHKICTLGDTFGSQACDCALKLHGSKKMIEQAGCGVIVYLTNVHPNGTLSSLIKRDQGVMEKQENSTPQLRRNFFHQAEQENDVRNVGVGSQILRALGLTQIRLLSTNTKRYVGLDGFGIKIVDQVLIEPALLPSTGNDVQTILEKNNSK